MSEPPREIKIWFTQKLEPSSSGIAVFDSQDKQLDKKDSHLDAKDKSLLIVSLPVLPEGTYRVAWHAVCADGHQTKGSFKFTVKR